MPNSPPPPPPVAPYPPPSPQMMEVDLTIVSAKHLKNVNWRNGGVLKPYAVFWVEPERRLATKSDDSGCSSPVWNERFTIPMASTSDPFLTLEIFHSKPSETPKPLVGTLGLSLRDLPHPDDASLLRTFPLSRPSGRPHGKLRLKLSLRRLPPPPPPPSYYYGGYSPSPPPPYYYSTASSSPSGSSYYPGYYSVKPFFGSAGGGGGVAGPSAPLDYDQGRPKPAELGVGVGAISGALGGLGIHDDKIPERAESVADRDDYADYRRRTEY